MNRNSNAHFAQAPTVGIRRSIMDRSHSHKTSGFVGDVIPIWWDEILPGDTVSLDTSKVIRFQTMLSPVMDSIFADFYTFFCPDYILWDHANDFYGENNQAAWAPTVTYSIPQLKVPPTGVGSNNKRFTILDYLGYPVELQVEDPDNPGSMIPAQTGNVEISALPFRAYAKICQDWFLDTNLSDPINLYTGDATVTASTAASYVDDVPHGGLPFKAAKFKDFWTSMLPAPQAGDPVEIDLFEKDFAPVYPRSEPVNFTGISPETTIFTQANGKSKFTAFDPNSPFSMLGSADYDSVLAALTGAGTSRVYPSNLWTDLRSVENVVSINELRTAFQIQRLLEKDARGGHGRYKEIIASHFNVDTGDTRLWRSEYLGGNRVPINVNQVSNHAQTSTDFLGDLGAYSLTVDVHSDLTKSFSVHGIIMTVMVIRAEHSYCQGIAPKFLRKDRYDYYWPVLANIGEQPYKKESLFLGASGTFGYNEAWAEYRFAPNELSGTMRPYLSGSLGSWNLGDDYASAPSLSDSWIREPRENVDRALAVTSQTAEQFWADIYFKVKHTRPMPVFSIPGLIDHH